MHDQSNFDSDAQSQPPGGAPPQQPVDPQPVFSTPPPPPPGGPVYYAPPPVQNGGFWGKARNVMVTVMLVGSLLINLIFVVVLLSFLSGGVGGGNSIPINEHVIRSGDSSHRIALIEIKGMIEPKSTPTTLAMLDRAAKDSNVDAILLRVDSPGGYVTDSDEIHRRVKQIHGGGKHLVVSMAGVAASGGYYVAVPADVIMAQPTTMTGSIGVIAHFPIVQRTLSQKLGVDMITMTSSEATMKDAANVFEQWTEEDRRYIQNFLDSAHEQFVGVVISGRDGLTEEEVRKLADGSAYTAQEALGNGLIDKVGYLDDAIAECERLAGVTNAEVRRYHRQELFGGLIGSIYQGRPFNGNVNVSFPQLESARIPKFLYVWEVGGK